MDTITASPDRKLEAIALHVLKEYGIVPESITMVQGGTIKTVWKLKTKDGQLCLKRLKQTYDKALFSVHAQIHIKNSGGKVPGIIPGKAGQPIVQHNGELFVLYEWIEGRDLNFGKNEDLRLALQGLARFHAASRGYRPEDYCPDESSRISTKLGKWPEQYESMRKKLSAWKEIAEAGISLPYNAAYCKYSDSMIQIASLALEKIRTSNYESLTYSKSQPDSTFPCKDQLSFSDASLSCDPLPGSSPSCSTSSSIVLCHQDFGRGNVVAAADGVYVLDLDGVTYDLAARDLRKIIGKNAENKGRWQVDAIEEILGWYMEINPLNEDEIELLQIDLLFPHWFFGLVKNLFAKDKPVKAGEIERIARLEEAKVPVLKAWMKWSE